MFCDHRCLFLQHDHHIGWWRSSSWGCSSSWGRSSPCRHFSWTHWSSLLPLVFLSLVAPPDPHCCHRHHVGDEDEDNDNDDQGDDVQHIPRDREQGNSWGKILEAEKCIQSRMQSPRLPPSLCALSAATVVSAAPTVVSAAHSTQSPLQSLAIFYPFATLDSPPKIFSAALHSKLSNLNLLQFNFLQIFFTHHKACIDVSENCMKDERWCSHSCWWWWWWWWWKMMMMKDDDDERWKMTILMLMLMFTWPRSGSLGSGLHTDSWLPKLQNLIIDKTIVIIKEKMMTLLWLVDKYVEMWESINSPACEKFLSHPVGRGGVCGRDHTSCHTSNSS